jgi:hypothetical protein
MHLIDSFLTPDEFSALADVNHALRNSYLDRKTVTFRCRGDEERLLSFLAWLAAHGHIVNVDLRIDPATWSRHASKYLAGKTFDTVRIHPVCIDDIWHRIWIPNARVVESGFSPSCHVFMYNGKTTMAGNDDVLDVPFVRSDMLPHNSLAILALAVTGLDRIDPHIGDIACMCHVVTNDTIHHLGRFMHVVNIANLRAQSCTPDATPATFAARELHVSASMLQYIASAPHCEVLHIHGARSVRPRRVCEHVRPDTFPRIRRVSLKGIVAHPGAAEILAHFRTEFREVTVA